MLTCLLLVLPRLEFTLPTKYTFFLLCKWRRGKRWKWNALPWATEEFISRDGNGIGLPSFLHMLHQSNLILVPNQFKAILTLFVQCSRAVLARGHNNNRNDKTKQKQQWQNAKPRDRHQRYWYQNKHLIYTSGIPFHWSLSLYLIAK